MAMLGIAAHVCDFVDRTALMQQILSSFYTKQEYILFWSHGKPFLKQNPQIIFADIACFGQTVDGQAAILRKFFVYLLYGRLDQQILSAEDTAALLLFDEQIENVIQASSNSEVAKLTSLTPLVSGFGSLLKQL